MYKKLHIEQCIDLWMIKDRDEILDCMRCKNIIEEEDEDEIV